MPPEIIGYNPRAGIEGFEQAGDLTASILSEANKAQADLAGRKRQAEATQYLTNLIAQREAASPNGLAGRFPLFDPQIRNAALQLGNVAPDYIKNLADLHNKNVEAVRPTPVAGGVVQFDPTTGGFKFERTASDEDGGSKGNSWWSGIFDKSPTLIDISALSHLNDKDILVDDGKGNMVLDPVRLSKKIIGDQGTISGLRTGASTEASTDVTTPIKEKAARKEKQDAFNSAVSVMKSRGFSQQDIVDVVSGNIEEATPSGAKRIRKNFSDINAGIGKTKPEINALQAAWGGLPKADQDSIAAQWGVVAPAAADTTKPKKASFEELLGK